MTGGDQARAEAFLAAREQANLADLVRFLAFPSVSTQSDHRQDLRACAAWLADHLRAIGLDHVALIETSINPVVYADWLHAGESAPTVLVYGHYDVQPAEPLELWSHPPFEASIRDGRLYARGAADNKGNVFAHLKAVEALLATSGRLPVNVKVLIEGQEELGSAGLDEFIREHRSRLAADISLNSDSGIQGMRLPTIVTGLRGVIGLNFTVRTGAHDLHSGKYGGVAPNALHVMARLLSTLHDEAGRVAIEGFYDEVVGVPDATLAGWAELGLDEDYFRTQIGSSGLIGDPSVPPVVRAWALPTLDVNGMWGGYTGEGSKTVIPCAAHAKLSCRLVKDQDPKRTLGLVEAHLRRHLPAYAELVIESWRASTRAVLTAEDHPAVQAARAATSAAFDAPCRLARTGWSVPIVEMLSRELGVDSVMLGFALPDAGEHAPDEHLEIEAFNRGARAVVGFLLGYGGAARVGAGGGGQTAI